MDGGGRRGRRWMNRTSTSWGLTPRKRTGEEEPRRWDELAMGHSILCVASFRPI